MHRFKHIHCKLRLSNNPSTTHQEKKSNTSSWCHITRKKPRSEFSKSPLLSFLFLYITYMNLNLSFYLISISRPASSLHLHLSLCLLLLLSLPLLSVLHTSLFIHYYPCFLPLFGYSYHMIYLNMWFVFSGSDSHNTYKTTHGIDMPDSWAWKST